MAPEYEVNCLIRVKGSSDEYKPAAVLQLSAENEAEAARIISRWPEPCPRSHHSDAELTKIEEGVRFERDHQPFKKDGGLCGGF